MASRNNPRCRRCPGQPSPIQAAAQVEQRRVVQAQPAPELLTLSRESELLWKQVLFAVGTFVGMLEGYANLNLPGAPVPHVYALIRRLVAVTEQLEERNENRNPKG